MGVLRPYLEDSLIKLIHDKITLIYSVKNEFNPTSEVQNIGNGAFQNTPFANALFANGSFPNGGYRCLWAISGLNGMVHDRDRMPPPTGSNRVKLAHGNIEND